MLNTNTPTQDIPNNINELDENTKNVFFMLRSMPETELKKLLWKLRFLNGIGSLCMASALIVFISALPYEIIGFISSFYPYGRSILSWITEITIYNSIIILLYTLGYMIKNIHSHAAQRTLKLFISLIILFSGIALGSFFLLHEWSIRLYSVLAVVLWLLFWVGLFKLIKNPYVFGNNAPSLKQVTFFIKKRKLSNSPFSFDKKSKANSKWIIIASGICLALIILFFCLSITCVYLFDTYRNIKHQDFQNMQSLLLKGELELILGNNESAIKHLKESNRLREHLADTSIGNNDTKIFEYSCKQIPLLLAYCNINEIGCSKNYKSAIRYLEDCSTLGGIIYPSDILSKNPKAIYLWGIIFYEGYGVEQDFAKAAKCFQEAAQGGCEEAKVLLSCKNELPPYKNVSFEEFLRQKYYGAFPKETKPESTKEKDSPKAELEPRKEKDCEKAELEPAKEKGNKENSSQQNKE